MKKLITVLMMLSIIWLAACGEADNDQASQENAGATLKPVEVKFLTEADAFKPGEEGKVKVKVTQGGKSISDADEVLFEVWKNGHKDTSKKMEAESEGDGVYSLNHTFDEKGSYKVTAHVTANSMHTMPTKEFNVGGAEDTHAHGDHHGESEVMVMLMKEDHIEANKEVTLTAHLQKENKAFTDASVKFEYWLDGQKKHTFVDAEEKEAGKYNAKVAFKESGTYTVKTHVKKGEIHTHKEETIKVQ